MQKDYSYDSIFREKQTQKEISEISGKKICDSTLEGYNGIIFEYGQTGTGKSYTIVGYFNDK